MEKKQIIRTRKESEAYTLFLEGNKDIFGRIHIFKKIMKVERAIYY